MNTYLVVCGIILHVIVLFVVIYGTIDAIRVNKYNKKQAAKKAARDTAYKEELKAAIQAWILWAKKFDDLQKKYNETIDRREKSRLSMELFDWQFHQKYYFHSTKTSRTFLEIGQENRWSLEDQTDQISRVG